MQCANATYPYLLQSENPCVAGNSIPVLSTQAGAQFDCAPAFQKRELPIYLPWTRRLWQVRNEPGKKGILAAGLQRQPARPDQLDHQSLAAEQGALPA